MKTETKRKFCCYDQLRWYNKHYSLTLKTGDKLCAYCTSPTPMEVKVLEERSEESSAQPN